MGREAAKAAADEVLLLRIESLLRSRWKARGQREEVLHLFEQGRKVYAELTS